MYLQIGNSDKVQYSTPPYVGLKFQVRIKRTKVVINAAMTDLRMPVIVSLAPSFAGHCRREPHARLPPLLQRAPLPFSDAFERLGGVEAEQGLLFVERLAARRPIRTGQ